MEVSSVVKKFSQTKQKYFGGSSGSSAMNEDSLSESLSELLSESKVPRSISLRLIYFGYP